MITNDSQMTGAIGESLAAAAGYKPAPQLGSLQLPLVPKTLSVPPTNFF